jgi:hypothetical protein
MYFSCYNVNVRVVISTNNSLRLQCTNFLAAVKRCTQRCSTGLNQFVSVDLGLRTGLFACYESVGK